MIIELGELTSFNKGESTAIKRAITTASDVFRTPFDKYPAEHGRTSVFVGTTNQDEYLADSTGGRRFWPLTINTINLDGIKLDRDQLFAEAVHRYKAGESWWIVPDSAKLEQDQRQEGDVWTERVEKYIYAPQRMGSNIFTIDEILEFGLNVSPDKMNKNMKDRVGNILRKLGLQNKTVRVDGKEKKRWVILNENGSHVTYVSPRQGDLVPNNIAIKKLPNFAPGMEND
jgi:putative DNA primase/helicase